MMGPACGRAPPWSCAGAALGHSPEDQGSTNSVTIRNPTPVRLLMQADLNGDGHLEVVVVLPDLKLQVCACVCLCEGIDH